MQTIFNSHCAPLLFGKISNKLRLQFNAKHSSTTKLQLSSVTSIKILNIFLFLKDIDNGDASVSVSKPIIIDSVVSNANFFFNATPEPTIQQVSLWPWDTSGDPFSPPVPPLEPNVCFLLAFSRFLGF